MKRFVLFAGEWYYPVGGWKDRQGGFNTAEEATREAIRLIEECGQDWAHVIDVILDQEVVRLRRPGYVPEHTQEEIERQKKAVAEHIESHLKAIRAQEES